MGHTIRYIPLLKETFTFPQSLGILGGKPGASTYIAGVQDDRALYLDPHEVQLVKTTDFSVIQHIQTSISQMLQACSFCTFGELSNLIYKLYGMQT